MGKNAKEHRKKVQARNQRNIGLQKKYQAAMETEMQKYLEKLSGMTETQSSGEVSGPVQ